MRWIAHVASDYNAEESVQRCLLCGYKICDGAGKHIMSADGAVYKPGFDAGPVYVSVSDNPRMTTTIEPADITDSVVKCVP